LLYKYIIIWTYNKRWIHR